MASPPPEGCQTNIKLAPTIVARPLRNRLTRQNLRRGCGRNAPLARRTHTDLVLYGHWDSHGQRMTGWTDPEHSAEPARVYRACCFFSLSAFLRPLALLCPNLDGLDELGSSDRHSLDPRSRHLPGPLLDRRGKLPPRLLRHLGDRNRPRHRVSGDRSD